MVKRRWIIWLFLLGVLLTACTGNKAGTKPPVSIRDALQIKAYAYNHETNSFVLTTLEPNEPVIVRHGGTGMVNTNLQFCFEGGVCEVTSDDEDIQLSIGTDGSYWAEGDLGDYRTYGFSFTVGHEGYVTACPVAIHKGWFSSGAQPELAMEYDATHYTHNVGREYYLTVKAKDFDTTMVTARLKLVQLADGYTSPKDYRGDFTVELISYEYSDMYAIMEAEQ